MRIILFLTSLLFISCNLNKGNEPLKRFEISYFKGNYESRASVECGSIKSKLKDPDVKDTFITNQIINEKIINEVQKLKFDSSGSSCDSRIECRIRLTKSDSLLLCIGNCLILNGQKKVNNDSLVYLIRRYSGYYNYFTREDLIIYFPEIKLFGIPSDYKKWIRTQDPNKPPFSPAKLWLN